MVEKIEFHIFTTLAQVYVGQKIEFHVLFPGQSPYYYFARLLIWWHQHLASETSRDELVFVVF